MRRVVLLGASNLTIAFPMLLDWLGSGHDGRVDVIAALGHGRSFGRWSQVLGRALPGITQCGLWRHLADGGRPPCPLRAVVTDVGNDLLYGATTEEIVRWVETCLSRLSQRDAEIVFTLLPMASIQRLSRWRFHLLRSILFPRRWVSWPQMRECVHELDCELRSLGERLGIPMVTPRRDWYGFDPIHIHRCRRVDAWRSILSGWQDWTGDATSKGATWSRTLGFRGLRAAERRLLGRPRETTQPVLESERMTVSLY